MINLLMEEHRRIVREWNNNLPVETTQYLRWLSFAINLLEKKIILDRIRQVYDEQMGREKLVPNSEIYKAIQDWRIVHEARADNHNYKNVYRTTRKLIVCASKTPNDTLNEELDVARDAGFIIEYKFITDQNNAPNEYKFIIDQNNAPN